MAMDLFTLSIWKPVGKTFIAGITWTTQIDPRFEIKFNLFYEQLLNANKFLDKNSIPLTSIFAETLKHISLPKLYLFEMA